MTDNLVTVRVWGDFACFTRPEMKVERVSYPVITPAAARGQQTGRAGGTFDAEA